MGLPACGIPENKLPSCWSDDVRMNALFAPFRIKSTNVESWNMKMKFWSDMLRQWCKYRKDPIISAADAKVAFQRKGRTPACLDIVIEEMFRNNEFCLVLKYLHTLHENPQGWMSWGARLAFKPASIAITAVTSLLPARQAVDTDGLPKASIDSTQRFVLESAVKEQATELLENYPLDCDRIGTIDELMKNSKFQQSREVFEILLGWLVTQHLAVKKDNIVKLGDVDKKATQITQSDEALVKLISAEKKLESDVMKSAKDLSSAESDARAALQIGNRLSAKNHLRRKHRINQRYERSLSALDNVRQLLQQMKDQNVNVAIVDTYRTSSVAMKQGMKENGLEVDNVLDTMADLNEVLDSYNEVEKALVGNIEDYDTEDLEEELEELLSGGIGEPKSDTPGKKKGPEEPKGTPVKKISERDFIFDGEARMLAELNDLDVEESSPEKKVTEKEGSAEKVAVKKNWEKGKVNDELQNVVVTENWEKDGPSKDVIIEKPSKPWYPPSEGCLHGELKWGDYDIGDLRRQYNEERRDRILNRELPEEMRNRKPFESWTEPPGAESRVETRNNNNNVVSEDIKSQQHAEVRQDERLHPGQKLNVDFSSPPKHYSSEFQVQDHKRGPGYWLFNPKDDNGNVDGLDQSTDYFSSESPGKTGGGFQMAPGGERHTPNLWPNETSTTTVPSSSTPSLETRLKNLRGFK